MAAAAQPMGVIEVVNTTNAPLDMVLISACGGATDSANRLAGIVIAPAASRQFDIAVGCWDVDAGASGIGEARQRLTVHANAISRYTVTG